MKTGHKRTGIKGLLAILAIAAVWQTLPDDSAMMTELKSMNQKIDDNAEHLADQVNDLEQRLTMRTEALENQTAQLRSSNPDIATADINEDIASAQNAMERLKQELEEMRDTHEIPATVNSTAIPTPEQIEAQADEQRQLQEQLLETTLISEASDPDWSIAAEEQVRAGISKIDTEMTVNDLICATTMCKLEASSKAEDPAEIFRSVDEHLAWEGEIFMTIDLDEGRTTAWLGRPGESLPRANNGTN